MLGLGNSITSGSAPASGFSPEQISTLVGWWDFTDTDTMFTDAGTTKVSSNDDKIYRINNKAYSLIGTPANALGIFYNKQLRLIDLYIKQLELEVHYLMVLTII